MIPTLTYDTDVVRARANAVEPISNHKKITSYEKIINYANVILILKYHFLYREISHVTSAHVRLMYTVYNVRALSLLVASGLCIL